VEKRRTGRRALQSFLSRQITKAAVERLDVAITLKLVGG
jgi:hypothetical protein